MESPAILIREARKILNGESFPVAAILALAKRLKSRNVFAYAAQLFEKLTSIGEPEAMDYYYQQLALCTYKDPDLPSAVKFELAESFLSKIGDPFNSKDSEVLGMMGGVYKRRWMYDNQFKNLLFSRHFYKRGYAEWKRTHIDPIVIKKTTKKTPNYVFKATKKVGSKGWAEQTWIAERLFKFIKGADDERDYDMGYTAINYAFLLDLLADTRINELRKIDGDLPKIVGEWRRLANVIREEIITYLQGDAIFDGGKNRFRDNWAYATLGEAYFGLGHFEKALFFYKKYGESNISLWEGETCRKQLLALAQFRAPFDPTEVATEDTTVNKQEDQNEVKEYVRKCLNAIWPPEEESEDNKLPLVLQGKVGLGLSGGGFRASLYHIGTLAKLAELDVLRHVEVLSCVSGGSIVGAHYYLLLRRKLMDKYDGSFAYMHPTEKAELVLRQQDYLDIVEELATHFLKGVQKNLRMRVLSGWKNLRIFMDRKYTRSRRIGELYEKHLYEKIFRGADGTGDYNEKTLLMHNLKVLPRGASTFNPKTDNWDRTHKVPMLVLNATTLNTGHNWQFTASWMGEPPGNIIQSVDSKPRLRRMYYEEAPPPHTNNIRLGQAVGASSCVPALFEPIFLPGIYPGVDLRLADGGIHDNQGTSSLIEQECSIIILSDASGQLNLENAGAGVLGSFYRSDSVLQERVRELQYTDLKARRASNQLKGLMYIHLKRDLNKSPLKWNGCMEPTRRVWLEEEDPNKTLTHYGIQKCVQERLANLRTDLDAFNDSEAYALMYSAYRQTEWAFTDSGLDKQLKSKKPACEPKWAFLSIAPFMEHADETTPLERRLEVGREMPFKVLHAYRMFGIFKILLGLALVCFFYWAITSFWEKGIQLSKFVARAAIIFAIGYVIDILLGIGISKFANPKKFFLKKAWLALGSVLVMVLFQIYLVVFNPIYLYWGKVENLRRPSWLGRAWIRLLDFLL